MASSDVGPNPDQSGRDLSQVKSNANVSIKLDDLIITFVVLDSEESKYFSQV